MIMRVVIFILGSILLAVCHGQTGPSCLSCERVAKPEDCNEKIQCMQGESCMAERYVTIQGHVFYDLGCKMSSTCNAGSYTITQAEIEARIKSQVAVQNGGIVGRKRQFGFEVVHTCQECCESDHCNNYLCGGHETNTLKCVSCQGVASMSYCDKLETCSPHEVCYIQEMVTDRFELIYNGGCMREVQCNAFLANTQMFAGAPNAPCANCCNDSFCNSICNMPTPPTTTPVPTTTTATTTAATTTAAATTTTTTTPATTTKSTAAATTTSGVTTTICPPFPLPTLQTPPKVNNTFVQLGCGEKQDIMFLVDNSKNINDRDEYYFEVFAQALIESMVLGPDAARVGYSYFGGDVHHVVDLAKGDVHSYVDQQLKNLEAHRGSESGDADLNKALTDSISGLSKGRPDAGKTIVLMVEKYKTDLAALKSTAQRLRKDNVTVIVLAVGDFSGDETNMLKDIASVPDDTYLFKYSNFNPIKLLLEDITLSRCKEYQVIPTLQPDPCSGRKLLNFLGCGAEEDIVMLLDRSGSIMPDDWVQIHKFVHDMVDKFNIAPDASRLGLITFNDNVTVVIKLHELPDKAKLLGELDTKLNALQPTGETMTGDALQTAIEWYTNSKRPGAIKTAIVFTDGGSDTKFATVARSLELHRMNVSVFVIGIGHDVDIKEQLIIASDPDVEHMINVKDVDGLLKYLTYLEAIRCRELAMNTQSTSTPNPTVAVKPVG